MCLLQAILNDISKGKITSSGVTYNSFRRDRSTDNVAGTHCLAAQFKYFQLTDYVSFFYFYVDMFGLTDVFLVLIILRLKKISFSEVAEGTDEKQVILPSDINEEPLETLPIGSNKDSNKINTESISYSNGPLEHLSYGK